MSYENQEYTEHVAFHSLQFNKNCEWCVHERRPQPKKLKIEALGEKLRKVANNMEKVGKWVEVLDKAKKNNKKGLIF